MLYQLSHVRNAYVGEQASGVIGELALPLDAAGQLAGGWASAPQER